MSIPIAKFNVFTDQPLAVLPLCVGLGAARPRPFTPMQEWTIDL
jgi:hypothetical protein